MESNRVQKITVVERSTRLIACLFLFITFTSYSLTAYSADQSVPLVHTEPKRIVLLYGERIELPGMSFINDRLNQTLLNSFPYSLEIYREEMDLTRFSGEHRKRQLQTYLTNKYAGKKIDVVVAVMESALDFMLGYGKSIFPEAGIVFCAIDSQELRTKQLPANVTGVVTKRQFSRTLELALALQPDLKHVIVVSGASELDARLLAQAKIEMRKFESRVDINYMVALPMRKLLEMIAHLPEHTVILYTTVFQDGAGQVYFSEQVVERVSTIANAPVYGIADQHLGHGIVGGQLYNLEFLVNATAGLVGKILTNANPAKLPVIEQSSSQPLVDWRQLRRWKIAEHRLPKNAIVKFREPSLWTQHRSTVIAAVMVLVVLALLTGGLFLKHVRLQRVKTKLGLSESRFRHLIESQMDLVCRHLPDTTLTFVNEAFCRFFGMSRDELMGKKFIDLLAEPARQPAMNKVQVVVEHRQRCNYDFKMELANGNSGWHHWEVYPIVDDAGQITEIQAIARDITDRKRAEEANQNLTHAMRLAVAGELTAMVAHEVSQPLGAIMANADAAQIMLKASSPPVEELRLILADIRASDQRADQAIRRIRDLLRKREMQMQALDLNDTVVTTLQLVSGDALHRNIQISSDLTPALPRVMGDHIYLQQVLLNLIINGMDAMSHIPRASRNLTVQTKSFATDQIGVSVSDNGKGIEPQHVNEIFESFYTTKKNGMGLGLTICKSIIESHQGKIWVENKPSGGANFQFSLKVA